MIDMYASTLTELVEDMIGWKLNNTPIVDGTFSNIATTLTVPNVQVSDGGVYKMIVTKGSGNLISTSTASTTVHILG